jgi:diguanylate cyclase (GGDEF)-like protein
MAIDVAAASASLDVGTLYFVAICVTALLGLFLLFAWTQERIHALAWWGVAYLLGGASGALWRWGDLVAPGISSCVATTLLFVAVGMIWSAARLFHGRPVRRGLMLFGAAFWLAACFVPAFTESAALRLVVSALIVTGYTILTATELRLERRKSIIRRWPAIFVPMLHGAIFLLPVALATLSPGEDSSRSLAQGWIVVFAIEIVLYLVGTAFIVLILAKDRTVNVYKTAASTDALTGVLNRRGFFEAASVFLARNRRGMSAVSVLAFDLDHFKLINDRCGHIVGDAVLESFAKVARDTLRSSDILGRLGGEEFVALLPATLPEAAIAAARVRTAFAAASIVRNGQRIAATVSIGVASGSPSMPVDLLITRADQALYRAKANGRDRVETANDEPAAAPEANTGERLQTARRKSRRREKGAVSDSALQVASRRAMRAG